MDNQLTKLKIQHGQLLVQYDSATNTTNTLAPILPGTDIKVTFTVNVFTSRLRYT